jgi:predicted ABC-type transport system involved in lysophospholipase L1 biosynthesis ATPase subunit
MVTHDNNLGSRFTRRLQIADGQIETDSGISLPGTLELQ